MTEKPLIAVGGFFYIYRKHLQHTEQAFIAKLLFSVYIVCKHNRTQRGANVL